MAKLRGIYRELGVELKVTRSHPLEAFATPSKPALTGGANVRNSIIITRISPIRFKQDLSFMLWRSCAV